MAESFLISRLSSLGDVVCTLPAACALKAAYPGSHIAWLVDPRFSAVVDACSAVDETIAEKPRLGSSVAALSGRKFDAAFDLQGLFKSAWPIARAKATKKFGYHWQREASWLFVRPVRPDPTSLHVVDQYVDVVRAVGASDDPGFSLAPQPEAASNVDRMLTEAGVDEPFVVVNAGAAWATKRWPPESFADVVDRLAAIGVGSVLIGSKSDGDVAAAAAVRQACKSEPFDFLGCTSIAELIALIARCAAHVGGDTGSTHIAAALGKPAVGLYSITRPERSCPYGQRHRTHYSPSSLSDIQPEDVYATLVEVLV